MARIPYPTDLSQETQDLLVRNGSLNVNRLMAHSLPVHEGFSKLGRAILAKGKLDPALRELAILRIGVNCQSEYEWRQHVGYARAVGTREAAIQAVRSNRLEDLNDVERVVVDFADEIFRNQQASEATFARAAQRFDHERLVELAMTCGFYIMTAGFLKTFAVEAEDTPPLGETVAARLAAKAKGEVSGA